MSHNLSLSVDENLHISTHQILKVCVIIHYSIITSTILADDKVMIAIWVELMDYSVHEFSTVPI